MSKDNENMVFSKIKPPEKPKANPEQASKPFHEKLLESEKIVCLITGKTYETKGLIAFKHFNEWYFRTQDGEEIQAKHLRSPKDVEKFKSERWRQNKPAFGK